MKVEEFKALTYIFKQGETSRKFYIILKGSVSIRHNKKAESSKKLFKENRADDRKPTFKNFLKRTENKSGLLNRRNEIWLHERSYNEASRPTETDSHRRGS